MTKLHYSALDADNSEIRLFEIAPGDGDDEICCSLSVVSLNNHPRFEALSYVWGDPSIKKNVTVDGASHLVTVNLESALRDLRYPSNRRTIWADAICINQDDLDEKNHQIPLMGDIYRKASQVVAYLGHSNPYLEYFGDWSRMYSGRQPLLSSGSCIPQKGAREEAILTLKSFLGCLEFISHPYFSRMWTFQEFLLPSQMPIFVMGKMSFQIAHTPELTWMDLFMRLANAAKDASWRLSGSVEPEAQELRRLYLRGVAQSVTGYDLSLQLTAMGEILAGPRELSVAKLFQMTIHRNCYNPRDKIFALHSFFQKLVPGICAPDYRKSVDDVLLETLSKLHQHMPPLIRHLMATWGFRASRVEHASGPSWLPDITATDCPLIYDARPTVAILRISEDFLTLPLGARYIGKCHRSLISLGSNPMVILRRIARLMYSDGEDLYSFAGSEIRMRGKEHRSERIFYALQAWTPTRQDTSPRVVQVLLSIFTTIAQHEDVRKLKDIPLTAEQKRRFPMLLLWAKDYLIDKAFFWTDTGLFGISSERLREGDTIALAPELPRPFAVRTRLGASDQSNHYCMVDWAFVDGLQGPTMDPKLISDIQKTPLSDILIH
ncbi:unnamed protein product [Clonostachys byssicola]|uniref:Heterokaryon incompatibility domain-containing protein n=1 Tax=Clonostachys byssicola TaxID=160290 RepID=A0A9N9U0M5_9HYPO|nr:unnamed protein product [Clonostachys byssicola]